MEWRGGRNAAVADEVNTKHRYLGLIHLQSTIRRQLKQHQAVITTEPLLGRIKNIDVFNFLISSHSMATLQDRICCETLFVDSFESL